MMRDQASYDALVAAYRAAPANHPNASRATGWTIPACRYVWEVGWGEKRRGHVAVPGLGPIKAVIAAEKDRARAEAAERARKDRELEDAAATAKRRALEEALTQESELLNENRRGLLQLSRTITRLMGVLPVFAKVVQDTVTTVDANGHVVPLDGQNGRGLPSVTAMQALKIMRDMSTITNRVAYAASALVELGRLDRGQSTANVAVVEVEDAVDVLEELAASATLYDRLKAATGGEFARPEDADDPGPTLQ